MCDAESLAAMTTVELDKRAAEIVSLLAVGSILTAAAGYPPADTLDLIREHLAITVEVDKRVAWDHIDNLGDQFLRERMHAGKARHDFAIVAANIAEDRYRAGSQAARCAIAILLLHGAKAAGDFVDDLAFHES